MNIDGAFPSNYIKVSDLAGREVTVTIKGVQMEDMGDDREKPVVYFAGKHKGLVLNRTNAETIADVYGHDTEDWIDKPIVLFPAKTQFRGQMTPCIRVRVQQGVPAAEQQQIQQPQRKSHKRQPDGEQAPPQGQVAEDDVPF